MKITAEVFQAYLKCNTKCWFYSLCKRGEETGYAAWVKHRNDSYYSTGINHLFEVSTVEESTASFDRGDLKTARWRLARGLALEAAFLDSKRRDSGNPVHHSDVRTTIQEYPPTSEETRVLLVTNLQAVERLTSEQGRKTAQYIPIRFIFRTKVTSDDKLLLGFDALVLSEVLGRNVSHGRIIRGDTYIVSKVKTAPLFGKVRKRIERIVALLRSASPPDLELNRYCVECEFKAECREKAIQTDDLSLLQGMTLKERETNHRKGIFTVTQLSYTFRPRRRPKSLRGKKEKYHHSLKALAIREKKIHLAGNPELKIDGTPICLDVEALPDQGFYYLIGIRIRNTNSTAQCSLWADTTNDEEIIWREFLTILSSLKNPILVHYGSFETTFLTDMTRRYGGPPEGSGAATAIKSAVNLLSVIFSQVYFPSYSNGLKDISRFLGFEWSEPNVSGIQTIMWRENWHTSRESALKQNLITYNSEDCEAIFRVMDCLNNLSKRYSEASKTSPNDFVRADSLPSVSSFRFRKNQFALPELEEINSAAYWDYQRERLLLKSNHSAKKPAQGAAKKRKIKLRLNKIVLCPPPCQCPICGKTKIYKHQAYTKTILDLQFHKSGIKRWITKYLYGRYRCPACNTVFGGSERPWYGSDKFGGDLQAMSIYLNIALRLPQQRVAIFFNEILGLGISRAMANRIKSSAAQYYKPATDKLMDRIIEGSLIHADETKVNLKGQTGYVWAFSNLEEVVYLYAPTREGGWVLELLKEFKGVLVSDFYSVYDSLDCPQQKCLIHLIRDMNEALLKEPFNDEIKALVAEFAALVKPMIDKVDRFGLKTRFLRKHKKDVSRFFKLLSRQEFRTDAAAKCKVRLLRNQNQLFTFLDYDKIPWNNNNAEHALKAFVYLRRDISGMSTESGIRNYLILLSLCETCRIRGLSFLEFLRSRKTDVDAFAKKKPGASSPKELDLSGPH